jgi:hypothetical protein
MNAILLFLIALCACPFRVVDARAELITSCGAEVVALSNRQAHIEAAAFWRDFRVAVLSNDIARVMRLTKFPFSTTGELDDDPVAKHGPGAFPALFTRLLRQRERPSPGVSLTMRELIRQTRVLGEQNFNGEDDHFHVGAFYFGKEGGRWRLLEAYLAD